MRVGLCRAQWVHSEGCKPGHVIRWFYLHSSKSIPMLPRGVFRYVFDIATFNKWAPTSYLPQATATANRSISMNIMLYSFMGNTIEFLHFPSTSNHCSVCTYPNLDLRWFSCIRWIARLPRRFSQIWWPAVDDIVEQSLERQKDGLDKKKRKEFLLIGRVQLGNGWGDANDHGR